MDFNPNTDWQSVRNSFIRATGDTPGAMLEDKLIAAYADNPEAVERAFEKITVAYQAGRIRSPWGALSAEVAKALDANRNPTHERGTSRQKAIERAEQWIRTAGVYCERPTEIEQELFGSAPADLDVTGEPIVSAGNALLAAYANDADLRLRMVNRWRELRPTGERAERQQEERLARSRRQHDQIEAEVKLAAKIAEASR
jgi:hypothetical protein